MALVMMFVAEVPLSKRWLAPARLCAGAGRVFAPSVGGFAEEYQRDRLCIFRSGFRPRNATVERRRARNDKTEVPHVSKLISVVQWLDGKGGGEERKRSDTARGWP